jgi:hypothetical protein
MACVSLRSHLLLAAGVFAVAGTLSFYTHAVGQGGIPIAPASALTSLPGTAMRHNLGSFPSGQQSLPEKQALLRLSQLLASHPTHPILLWWHEAESPDSGHRTILYDPVTESLAEWHDGVRTAFYRRITRAGMECALHNNKPSFAGATGYSKAP